jgi:hypothetical protein
MWKSWFCYGTSRFRPLDDTLPTKSLARRQKAFLGLCLDTETNHLPSSHRVGFIGSRSDMDF